MTYNHSQYFKHDIVEAAIIEDSKILLLDTKKLLKLPGGIREQDESDIGCLERILKKNIGISPQDSHYYATYTGIDPKKRIDISSGIYRVTLENPLGISRGDFSQSFEWLTPEEVETDQRLINPVTYEVINSLIGDGYLHYK